MKTSLKRAFIFSLLTFFALNLLFYIIGYSLSGVLDYVFSVIVAHPPHIIYIFIYSSTYFPWELIANYAGIISLEAISLGALITFIITPIVAGIMGGDIRKSFGGWILTMITSTVLLIVIATIDDLIRIYVGSTTILVDALIIIVIAGAVNALTYGVIVIIIAAKLGKSYE